MATITITTMDLHEAGALLSTLYKRHQPTTTVSSLSPTSTIVSKTVKAALRRAETKVKAKTKRRAKAKPGTQTAKIRTLSRKGLKIAQIAARLKINSGTVWHALHG